jgi:fatty aldehyde-generating acyl-ACP reductase
MSPVKSSVVMDDLIAEADIIISVASSSGIKLTNCKRNVLICDAGYPKNLETKIEQEEVNLFHGGMGQVNSGYSFNPDYSSTIYRYAAPHIIHGCILEAMVLAFENKFEAYSAGKGNISVDKMEAIYNAGLKHGIELAPFYNAKGLW